MNIKNWSLSFGAAAAALVLSSCGLVGTSGSSGVAAYQRYDRPTSLPSNASAVQVKVSLSRQRVYVMEGSKPLLVMPVCVGASNAPTPTGSYRIQEKVAKYRANTHGYATKGNKVMKTTLAKKPAGWSFKGTPMPYWCGFKPAYGFHTGWVKNTPASHGCIRMHENLAPKFFRLVKIGTPVTISRSLAEDKTLGSIPLPPDAGPLPDYNPTMYVGDGYFSRHIKPSFQ